MTKRKPLFFALLAAVLLLVAGILIAQSIPKPEPAFAAPWTEILRSGRYYMDCSVPWLLNQPEPVELEWARDGGTTFQRYPVEDGLLVSTARDGVTKFWINGKLEGEGRGRMDNLAPDCSGLKYTGKKGQTTWEGQSFTYVEYLLPVDGSNDLRLLFSGEELWGLQWTQGTSVTRVLSLSGEIPQEIQDWMAK